MSRLPGGDIVYSDKIIPVGYRFFGYIDHYCRSYQVFERYLLGRPSPPGKMDGRIEMRSTVFRCGKRISRIIISCFITVSNHLQLKRFNRGPKNGFVRIFVRQVNPPSGWKGKLLRTGKNGNAHYDD